MPLWKVYHPVGAFTAEDKKTLAKQVTEVYASIPIPKFYVVFIGGSQGLLLCRWRAA